MTFEEIVDQAMALLQRRGRVTYRMLKLQFQLDEGFEYEWNCYGKLSIIALIEGA